MVTGQLGQLGRVENPWITLHMPATGEEFHVRCSSVHLVRKPARNEFIQGSQAVVRVDGKDYNTKETPEEISKLMGFPYVAPPAG